MEACTIVIFGATGDLARKKLIPALYRLHVTGDLHKKTKIIAIGRREYTIAQLMKEYQDEVPKKSLFLTRWKEFARRITYLRLEFHDKAAYDLLARTLEREPRRLFYLATPQDAFPLIVENLRASTAAARNPKAGWHRVLFEKPFGSDLRSAESLNREVGRLFDERQIYRIDHYLGKSFVQEIFAIRFANPVFEHLWNKEYIDNVQIVVSETDTVRSRGAYYDNAGAIRDMVQNHLFQLLCLVAMEAPDGRPGSVREEKTKVLRALEADTAVLGQYTAGVEVGKHVHGYAAEEGVAKGSTTETFAAVKLCVRNARWNGVPFYLRTGKALKHRYAQIAITFKQASCLLFQHKCPETNVLIVRIQPDEGVKLRINLSEGRAEAVEPREMSFLHEARGFNTPEAYELLLRECIEGDQTLFTSWDFLQHSWAIIDHLRARKHELHPYPAGGHGPKAALDMIKKDGRDWIGNAEIIK